jgi:putative endopeptidase
LSTLAPDLRWDDYLLKRNVHPAVVNVTQPDFIRAVNGLVTSAPLETWKAYLKVRILHDASSILSSDYVKEWFALRQALSGAKEMLPRWKRCIAETDGELGEILGKEYLKEAFSPADKARMDAMVKNLRAALGDRIQVASWMGDSTRQAAAGKLSAFAQKIGYPDTWRNYSSVSIAAGQHYANRQAARAFESARTMAKIGKPVDRGEWTMTPPTVNAYYSASLNSINFPAGILQPPFFDTKADDATNYGAIGAVIGHEMGHGFDDRGRQFDANGNLRDWWSPADVERYKVQADRVRAQFDGYTVIDTLHVNGSLTLGENLADLGGLAVAYAAMEKAYASQSRKPIDGFTPEQRFFLGWARVWRNLQTNEDLRTQVQTDPHAPAKWRINGPMGNLPEFKAAWGCKDGDAMVRPEAVRAKIW